MIRNHATVVIVGLFVLFSQLSSDVLAAEKETKDSPLLALQNYAKALKAGDTKATFDDLGEQFVDALRNKDIVAYGQCWISPRRLRAVAIASDKPVSEKELAAMRAYFTDRNRHVAHSFKVLTEFFEKEGDITHLKITGIEGAVREKAGIRKTSGFRISVVLEKAEYSIRIDDGFEDGGSWFFSDKPMALEVLADKKRISLQIPSNDK